MERREGQMTPHRKQVAILKETYRAKQNTTPTGFRRLVSLILCLCLFLSILPSGLMTTALAASGTDTAPDSGAAVTVTHKGSAVDSLSLPQDERTTLTAVCASDVTDASYQWQILADVASELWVNIYDATEQSLALSCALLNSLADDTGSAYVRCRVTASGQTIDSNVVCVTAARTIPVETGAEDEADANAAPTGRVPALRAPARAPEATSEEYVEIAINYLDAVTKKSIYKSYQAQIKKGTSYTSNVISPAYLGYAPFYNTAKPSDTNTSAANDDATTIHLNILDSYSAPTYVVNVYYKAIDVPYAVRYYFQNIHDDTYSEDVGLYRVSAAKTGTIISDDKLKLSAGEAEGFTKLYHYPEAVAADGSTVFQCYYDRNYYMLKFDMDGGYGTEPVYARYGTAFIVNAPTRHGYEFFGWDDVTGGTGDGNPDTLPTTIPAKNRTYKALWHTVDTTYTTVYWLQNADDGDQYSFIGSVKGSAPSGTTVSGGDTLKADTPLCGNTDTTHTHDTDCYPQNFDQLVYNDAKTQKNVTIKGDGSTTVNVYYDRKAYTLRFFYARENKNTHQFQLVGGTTYPFGNTAYDRPTSYTVENLLDQVDDWGNITGVPQLKTEYTNTYIKRTLDSNGYTYYYLELKARFDADLSTLWPGDCFERVRVQGTHHANDAYLYMDNDQWGHYAYQAGWNGEFKVKYTLDNPNSTIKGMFQRLDENLLYGPNEGSSDVINFLGYFCNGADVEWSKPWQWLYELYVPVLDGEESDHTYNYKGTNYKLIKTIDTADNNREISHQTQPTLHGFEASDQYKENNPKTVDGRESFTAQFFYERESYTLTLHNYNKAVSTVELLYQTPLAPSVPEKPTYPSTLEADAYTFGGWYYSSGCYDGTKYQPGDTMPAGDITLYAKWTPVTRTVRFFQTYDAMLAYEKTGDITGLIETHNVAHGTRVGSVDGPTDNSGHRYDFSGWFYMLAGKKTAYAPQDIPVTRDLNVFADWGSHTAQPYLVHYALHTGEKDTKWTEALHTASGGTAPGNNQTFTVSVGSETRTYVYLTSDKQFHRQIAADSTGYAYQGNTRTFYPKVGDPLNELYADFNTGCYPTLASHSITVESESDKTAPVENVFTFTYAHTKSISYTVEYRYADNNELISSAPDNGSVEKSSDKAVVTERFAVIQDHIPDAFYKRLILAVKVEADGSVTSQDNVVVFYYTQNKTHAPYAVHHMLQTLDAALKDQSGLETDANGNYKYYAEDEARIQGIGERDSTLSVTPQTFSGFTVGNTGIQITTEITTAGTTTTKKEITRSGTDFAITIDKNGTDLYVFYTRNQQNYRVYYLKYGTPTTDLNNLVYNGDPAHTSGVLAGVKTDVGKFGQTVTEEAIAIEGWSCVSDKRQTLLLRSDEKQNNIFFFYQPVQYSVDYQVWPQGGGTVSPSKEVVEGETSFEGSTPTEKPGYRFEGWYLDETCRKSVTDQGNVDPTKNKLVPNKSELEAMPKVNTFYAKFVPVLGDLTITRSNASDDEGNGDRVFVYHIKAAEDPSFELFVSIKGNGSVTIKNLFCFTYTIEQQNGWSWRYNDTSQTVKVTENNNQTVTFGSAPIKNKWLNGSSEREVNRKR